MVDVDAQAESKDGHRVARGRLFAARASARLANLTSRLTRQGDGSSIGGEVARRIYPEILVDMAAEMDVALVTGTNGKSTTARMLASALEARGPVAFNSGGSNMENGAVVALATKPKAWSAALEVDEAFLHRIARATKPTTIVLLNLSREATRGVVLKDLTDTWCSFFSSINWPCTFVANADDPVVVSTVPDGAVTSWVSGGIPWTRDSSICPDCHATLDRDGTHWWCSECGLTRPTPDWRLDGEEIRGPGMTLPLALPLPGEWPRANALFAVAAASVFGIEPAAAAECISKIDDVEGRYRVYRVNGRDVRLIMVKNAASWDTAVSIAETGIPVVLAQEAFGIKDMAPLWEIDMADLALTTVVVTGQRRRDVATRLDAAGVEYTMVEDPLDAIQSVGPGPVYVIANYTAFLDLRRALRGS